MLGVLAISTESIFGVLITCILALAGLWVKHILDCRDRDKQRADEHADVLAALAAISSSQGQMQEELGTHDTGIIGQLHRYSKIITRLCDRAGIDQ